MYPFCILNFDFCIHFVSILYPYYEIYRLLSFGKTTDIKEEKSIIATYYCKKNSVLLSLFYFMNQMVT